MQLCNPRPFFASTPRPSGTATAVVVLSRTSGCSTARKLGMSYRGCVGGRSGTARSIWVGARESVRSYGRIQGSCGLRARQYTVGCLGLGFRCTVRLRRRRDQHATGVRVRQVHSSLVALAGWLLGWGLAVPRSVGASPVEGPRASCGRFTTTLLTDLRGARSHQGPHIPPIDPPLQANISPAVLLLAAWLAAAEQQAGPPAAAVAAPLPQPLAQTAATVLHRSAGT